MTKKNPSAANGASRRSFLTTAAAGVGASVLLGRPAITRATVPYRSEQPELSPPGDAAKTLKIGVIGLGGPGGCAMGLNHCLSFIELAKQGREKCEIAAICDLNDLFLANGKKEIDAAQGGDVKTFKHHKELLAMADLDGVLVAVPEHSHAIVGIDVLEAKKDLYLEKPMTLNLEQAMPLYEAANRVAVIVQVGTQMTQQPKYHAARQLIRDGAIGTPTFSQTSYCRNSKKGEWHYTVDDRWVPGENLDWDAWCAPLGPMEWDPKVYYQWRRYKKTSTGIIGDLLVHVMTPMMMALDQGWPTRVVATGAHHSDKAMQNHDNINIAVQFETGHQMIVAGSTCNENGLESLIRGTQGNLYLNSAHCVLRPERIWAEDIEEQTIQCPDIGNDQDVHRLGWMHSIRTRQRPESSVELGMKVMVVVDLATRSMWEGKAFEFDPRTMTARAV